MIQMLPKIVNPFQLDQLLQQYGLVTETPTIDYIYSLAALGSSNPNDLQPLLEANNIQDLLKNVEELLKKDEKYDKTN